MFCAHVWKIRQVFGGRSESGGKRRKADFSKNPVWRACFRKDKYCNTLRQSGWLAPLWSGLVRFGPVWSGPVLIQRGRPSKDSGSWSANRADPQLDGTKGEKHQSRWGSLGLWLAIQSAVPMRRFQKGMSPLGPEAGFWPSLGLKLILKNFRPSFS
jgi:hypothetical protein